ncbi:MAG: M3 family metallopeptidase [Bacteroidales bacterium]|nr:M3 family metallopeptidase [Bacteroidales bacterium]
MGNPLLSDYNTPKETIPFNLIKTEHFAPALDTAFKSGRIEIDGIVNNEEPANFENTIEALERSGKLLDNITHIIYNLNNAQTDSAIQALVKELSPRLSEYQNDITLNEKLFVRIKTVYDNVDRTDLTSEQNMLLDKTYKSFIRNGANLGEKEKKEYREITKELAGLGVQFQENLLAETNEYTLQITDSADLSGLPPDAIKAAAAEATQRDLDGWVFTLKYPSFIPFIKYADNRELRKQLYIAYNTRGLKENENDNRKIVKRIAELRIREANLLGYDTYADYILDDRMAESSKNVNEFIDRMIDAYLKPAIKELADVQEFARSIGFSYELQKWDWYYFSEKLKKEKYSVDDQLIRPYFKLENVRKGIFDLAYKLYGITFVENKDIPVYNPDVVAYEVYDHDNSYLAVLYMDFFPRDSKQQGAWKTDYIKQYKADEKEQRPHVSMVFNFTEPTENKPSLLTYEEVRTFLHEFGHALHGIFTDVTYSSLSGTSVYRDFVELPSQIMENWAEQREWLDMVAVHYETGEKIPEKLLQAIINSKNYNIANWSVAQLGYGMIDMSWHSLEEPYQGDIVEFEKNARSRTTILPPIEGTAMSTSFGHIFSGGYAAGYYGYKWAEVLKADAFSLFLENGIFDKATAEAFRKKILSKGGTEHPMKLYIDFRGKEPSIEPLLEQSGLKNKS